MNIAVVVSLFQRFVHSGDVCFHLYLPSTFVCFVLRKLNKLCVFLTEKGGSFDNRGICTRRKDGYHFKGLSYKSDI